MDDALKSPRHSRWAWAGLAMVALVIVAVVVLFLARGNGSDANTTAPATAASGSVPSAPGPGATRHSPPRATPPAVQTGAATEKLGGNGPEKAAGLLHGRRVVPV